MCIHVFLTKRSYCKQEYQYNLMLKTKKHAGIRIIPACL